MSNINRRSSLNHLPHATPQQTSMWRAAQLGGLQQWIIGHSFSVRGRLNAGALRTASLELVRRHPALRTALIMDSSAALRQDDLQEYDPLVIEEESTPTTSTEWPFHKYPLRILVRQNGSEVTSISLHVSHLQCDGWSMAIVLSDLGDLYRAALTATSHSALSEPAEWRPHTAKLGRPPASNPHMVGDATEAHALTQQSPWTEAAGGSGVSGEVVAKQAMTSWADRSDKILQQADKHHTTPIVILAALMAIVMQRSNGKQTVTLGIPNANRPESKSHQTVGLFADLSVLKVDIDEALSFSDLAGQVRSRWLGVLSNGHIPFDSLARQNSRIFESAIVPLVDAVVSQTFVPILKLSGLETTHEAEEYPVAKYPVLCDFSMDCTPPQWRMVVPSRPGDREPEYWLEELGRTIDILLGNDELPMKSLPRLSQDEEMCLSRSEEGLPVLPSSLSFSALMEAAWKKYSHRIAFAETDRALTFAQSECIVRSYARALATSGAQPGDYVGVLAERSADFVLRAIAVMREGMAFVPIDPTWPSKRLSTLRTELNLRYAFWSEGYPLPKDLDGILVLGPEGHDTGQAADPAHLPSRESVAYVLATSGTTGEPKLVKVSQGALVDFALAFRDAQPSSGPMVVAWNAAPTFDAAIQQWTRLVSGDCIAPIPNSVRTHPRQFCDYLTKQNAQVLDITPTHLSLFSNDLLRQFPANLTMLVGGETIPSHQWKSLANIFPGRAFNLYGVTEAVIDSTMAPIAGPLPTIGSPLPGVTVRVLDDHLRRVPMGVPGSLYIGGRISSGYSKPVLTAGRFIPDPFGDAGVLYRSGDVAQWGAESQLHFLGRSDRQTKVRAHRIELGEVEAALACMPGIKDVRSAVVEFNEVSTLIAYCIPENDEVTPRGIERLMAAKVPHYLRPDKIKLVKSFPMNGSAKIDFAKIWDHTDKDHNVSNSEFVTLVRDAWQEVLGEKSLEVSSNFFQVGGNSIDAARIVGKLRDRTGLPIPLVIIFKEPTVLGLAAAVESLQQKNQA